MLKKAFRYFLLLSILGLLAIVLFIVAVNKNMFGHLYSEQELLDFKNEIASVVYSEEGKPIGKIFTENRTNAHYKEIPPHLINALVATEDARYFKHGGIDSRSLLRVLFKTILLGNKSSGGGSTLNQQLAKNISGRNGSGRFSMLINKTKEGLMAHRLEQVYTKEDILTLYFNTVPFGENIFGIESASLRFFNKEVTDLNLQEAAVLVGLLKANTYYNPRLHPENAIRRRNVVFGQMAKYKYIKTIELDSLKTLPLGLDYMNLAAQGPANYFLVQVKREADGIFKDIAKKTGKEWDLKTDGLIIKTSLNSKLQASALRAYQDHLSIMQKRLRNQYKSASGKQILKTLSDKELKRLKLTSVANQKRPQEIFNWEGNSTESISVRDSIIQSLTLLHAGLISLDPNTGAIKSYIGGIDFRNQPYDQITGRLSLASTFKPILYLAAMEQGILPCTYLDNTFETLASHPDWQPQNYDESEGGYYSMKGALTKSMNIPSVNLYPQVDFKPLERLWHKLGFAAKLLDVPSTALGTSTGSIFELALAYATVANGGYKITPNAIQTITAQDGTVIYEQKHDQPKERIISEESCLMLSYILQKAVTEGTGVAMKNTYNVELPLAGKTGTAQDFSNAWFACFNPNLVMVTRVNTSSNAIHFNNGANGAGSTLAMPLIAKTLKSAQDDDYLKNLFSKSFPLLPAEVYDLLVCEDFMEEIEIAKPKRFPKKPTIKKQPSTKKKGRKKKRKGKRRK